MSCSTTALAAEGVITALRSVWIARECEALTLLHAGMWQAKLEGLGLLDKYPDLVHGTQFGFRLGSQRITQDYHPYNELSGQEHSAVLQAKSAKEIALRQCIGPYLAAVTVFFGPWPPVPCLVKDWQDCHLHFH